MRKTFVFFLITLTLMLGIASCNLGTSGGSADIVVGAKNFTEQDILGELLAQQIEDTTGLKVERRLRLGGTFVCHEAILAGKIDAYVEYTGTALAAILAEKTSNEPQLVFQRLKQAYDQKFKLEVMNPLGFENTFAMIIRGTDAEKYNIRTLSEVAPYTPQWRAGFGYEFIEREDGFPGLAKTYNIRFARSPRIMDLGLIYRALVQKQVDFVAGNSTDGQIRRLGLVILEDDKKYFPPYEVVPIVRQETLQKHPEIKKAIAQLAGKITADEMQGLNDLVESELRDVKEVVREFRQAKGLFVS